MLVNFAKILGPTESNFCCYIQTEYDVLVVSAHIRTFVSIEHD